MPALLRRPPAVSQIPRRIRIGRNAGAMLGGQTDRQGLTARKFTDMTRLGSALALIFCAATLSACVDTDDYRGRPWRDHHWRDRDHRPDRPWRPDEPWRPDRPDRPNRPGSPTGLTGRIARIVLEDQTGRTGPTDRIGRTARGAPIASAGRQLIARPGLTSTRVDRIAAAARRRHLRLTVSSHAARAGRIPDWRLRPRICGLYKAGQKLLSNSYAARDYGVAGRRLIGGRTNNLASNEHEITFSLADFRGQPSGADGVFRPGEPQGTGHGYRPARRSSDRRYSRRCERAAIPFRRRRTARPQRALRCRSAPHRRMDRPARAGLCGRRQGACVKAATAPAWPAPVLMARHRLRCRSGPAWPPE